MNEKLTLLGEEDWNHYPFGIKSKSIEKYTDRFTLSDAAKLTGNCRNLYDKNMFWIKHIFQYFRLLKIQKKELRVNIKL